MVLKKKIGEGNTAEVYEYTNHDVLKLFYPHVKQSYINMEFMYSKEVIDLVYLFQK